MSNDTWERDLLAIDNADSYAELTAQLYVIRKKRGLRQQDVADRMKTSKSTVSRLEAGHGNPTMRTLQDYAEAVGAYLSFVAVPAHNTPEWQEQSRRVTEVLQSRFFVEVDEQASASGSQRLHSRVTGRFVPTSWQRTDTAGV